mgnify:CR=1 FL=1
MVDEVATAVLDRSDVQAGHNQGGMSDKPPKAGIGVWTKVFLFLVCVGLAVTGYMAVTQTGLFKPSEQDVLDLERRDLIEQIRRKKEVDALLAQFS